MEAPREEAENSGIAKTIEKSVLAFCGQAGLFLPLDAPFPDRRGQPGAGAVFGPGGDAPRHVVAAVSGGADSMALLRILLALAEPLALTVTACHVNHGLRGAPADRDEAFVRAECARLGVPLTVFSAARDGRAIPENAGEDWARRLRYGYFGAFAAEGHVLVATAHTLSDQAETLLFRLARGTGVHGAAGIAPQRGMYVRPLLCLTRQDTERYCAAAGQRWITDETNASDAYARNRLRHAALPALEAANPAAVRHLAAFCAQMAALDEYLAAAADALLARAAADAGGTAENGPWALGALRAAPAPVRGAALHRLVAPVRDAEEKYVCALEQLAAEGTGAVQLRADVRFAAAQGVLRRENPAPAAPAPAGYCVPLQPGEYCLGGCYRLKIEVLGAAEMEKTQSIHKKDLKNRADYAKIPMCSVLRARAPGDRFRPAGRGVEKSLKKLQNEQKTPLSARRAAPLLAAGSRVLWLWGAGFADGLAPDAGTQRILCITEQKMVEEKQA
jgi:tRNA(Ile)-lysidine synthase